MSACVRPAAVEASSTSAELCGGGVYGRGRPGRLSDAAAGRSRTHCPAAARELATCRSASRSVGARACARRAHSLTATTHDARAATRPRARRRTRGSRPQLCRAIAMARHPRRKALFSCLSSMPGCRLACAASGHSPARRGPRDLAAARLSPPPLMCPWSATRSYVALVDCHVSPHRVLVAGCVSRCLRGSGGPQKLD